ncbi:MAG: hypothetical protein KGR26_12775, partial [Cyanobacteria bacterium REEB65]|nr:hypothetical protein [Cyanobacteria bacterium REEB65]
MALADAEKLLVAFRHEAAADFCDRQGNRLRFSEFAAQELAALADKAPDDVARARFQGLQAEFGRYGSLAPAERRDLVMRVRAALPLLAASRQRAPERGAAANPLPFKASPKPAAPLSSDLSQVKGIGPNLTGHLAKLGITSLDKLLAFYPRTYLDYQQRCHIGDLQPGQLVTVWGTIRRVEAFSPPKRPSLSIQTVWIQDGTGTVAARWFAAGATRSQQEAWKKRFPPGSRILLSGEVKPDSYSRKLVFDRPEVEVLGTDESEEEATGL